MKLFSKYALQGLFLLLPLLLTLQLMVWLLSTIEAWLKPVWLTLLPDTWYLPGMAVVSFILLAAAIGALARFKWLENLWRAPERVIDTLPLFRNLYGTIKEIVSMMNAEKFTDRPVVEVSLPGTDSRLIGIVTATRGDACDGSALLNEGEVLVYLPMSYQVGGYMLVVPESATRRLAMKPFEAIQMVLTAGVVSTRNGHKAGAQGGPMVPDR